MGLLLRYRADRDALLRELLSYRNVEGKNLYGVALARMGRRQRSREEYAELGRKGATIRWARWRERREPQPSGGEPQMSEPATGNGTVLIAGAPGLEQSGKCGVSTAPQPKPWDRSREFSASMLIPAEACLRMSGTSAASSTGRGGVSNNSCSRFTRRALTAAMLRRAAPVATLLSPAL